MDTSNLVIGRVVHFRNESDHDMECRAAIVAAVYGDVLNLLVVNSDGTITARQRVVHDPEFANFDTWHWPTSHESKPVATVEPAEF